MSSEVLPVRIAKLEQQIEDLRDAIDLVKNPPKLKLDESGYPALDSVKQLLLDAQSDAEKKRRLDLLENEVDGAEQELEGLKSVLADQQEKISTLKQQQLTAFERYRAIESELLQQAKVVIAYSQAIEAIDANLTSPCKPAVIFESNPRSINRVVNLGITHEGRSVLSVKGTDLLESVNDGWGNSVVVPDFQDLIHEQSTKEAA